MHTERRNPTPQGPTVQLTLNANFDGTTERHQRARRPCTCALARRRLRNHCKTRVRGARLFLGHFLDQRHICLPVSPMPVGTGQGRRGAPPRPCWTLGPALGHPVLDKRFIPHHPGTATVPQAETCHCPGRSRGMLLLLVCCPPQPIHRREFLGGVSPSKWESVTPNVTSQMMIPKEAPSKHGP